MIIIIMITVIGTVIVMAIVLVIIIVIIHFISMITIISKTGETANCSKTISDVPKFTTNKYPIAAPTTDVTIQESNHSSDAPSDMPVTKSEDMVPSEKKETQIADCKIMTPGMKN